MLEINCYLSMITQHGWMFLGSYERLRDNIVRKYTMENMVHLGARAFDEISGEVVQTTTFVIRKIRHPEYKAKYMRVIDGENENAKRLDYLKYKNNNTYFVMSFASVANIPNTYFGYWLSDIMISHLVNSEKAVKYGDAKQGLITSDNERFLRLWY